MSTDMEKLILDKIEALTHKLDTVVEQTHKVNGEQNERIKAVEVQTGSTQNELTEYKNYMGKQLDKRGSNVFQIIGAIASGLTIIGLIITWILLMVNGVIS